MSNFPSDPIAANSPPIKVLIVDDSESDRKTYCRYLQSDHNKRFNILEAETLEEGLYLWQSQKPDVVVADFELPDGDGFEFLESIGKGSVELQIPAILLTGHGDEQFAVHAMKLGVMDYLVKANVTPVSLIQSISSIITRIALSRKLARAQQQEALIAQIALNVRQSLNLDDVYQAIVHEVRTFLNADRTVVYKFNTDMSGLVVAESIDHPWQSCLNAHIIDTCFQENLGGEYQQGKIFTASDIYAANLTECHLKLLESFQVRANLVVPILLDNPVTNSPFLWGLLVVHQCDAPRVWDDTELRLLQQLSVQLAIAIQQADELETSERKFRAIFNNTFQFTGLLTPDGILLEANQTFLRFGGLSRDDVIGRSIWDTYWWKISEQAQTQLKQAVEKASQGEFIRYETAILGAGGKVATIDFSLRPLRDETGQVILLIPEGRDITDRKHIEEALRKSESMLLEAQHVAKLGNWEFDLASQNLLWSEELFRIFDRNPEIGAPSYEEHFLMYEAEDRHKLQQATEEAIATGKSYLLEMRVPQPDGSYYYIEAIGHAERNANGQIIRLYGTAQDINDRKLAEEKLRQSEELLRLTINSAPVGIATLDLKGKYLTVNHNVCKIFGYSSEEMLQMTVFELTVPDSIEKTLLLFNQLIAGEVTNGHIEKQYKHKNGKQIDTIVHVGLVRDVNGNPIQFVAGIEDVTARKQAEAALETARRAEAANQAKSEFLAVMSHELRTPMNAVIGMTGLLIDTPLSSQQKEFVSTIRQGGEMLLSVINKVLDFSQIESGKIELEEHPFDLWQCIDEVLDLMSSRVAEKSLELSALINLDVPQRILGDSTRLRQILVNLVSNAIKFTERGEVVITVRAITIAPKSNTLELHFTVRDTGVGIAPAAIGKLFKAFSQADSSITRQYGGTGLGLAICQQLCELMGGEIHVKSEVGNGSTFSFFIRTQAIATEPEAIATELKDKRLLIVNANSTIRQILSLYSQSWGMIVQTASSDLEALQCMEFSCFDTVILDRHMLVNNEFKLAKSIQGLSPTLPLILLTSRVDSEEPSSLHLAACLTKPISRSRLYQVFLQVFAVRTSGTPTMLDTSKLDISFAKQFPLQILIAEDNPVNQRILALMLERLGYKGDAVGNGMEAVAALERQSYDLVFMDIQMPVMDGLTASQGIRDLSNRNPWIIGLSANAFRESREAALSAGMNDYLTKPLQIKELVAALQRFPHSPIQNLEAIDIVETRELLEIPPSPLPIVIDFDAMDKLESFIGAQSLTEIILSYLTESERSLAKMKEALRHNDLITLGFENHSFKGGSALFGAKQLVELCKKLQALSKSNSSLESLFIVLGELEVEYLQVVTALKAKLEILKNA